MRTILNKNENYSQLLEVVMSELIIVILASLAAGLLSLSVALVLLSSKKLSEKLVKYGTPFAAGVLLIIGFRDLLPEGIEEEGIQVLNATLGAVIIFFLIEKGFSSFHHHHEEDKPKDNNTQGWLFVIGDVFHNLIDGISLGGAFLLGRETGLLATFALISHDIPLEVGEFGNQLRVGFTKKQTIIRNIVSGSTTVIGAVLTFQIGGDLNIPMGYLYGGIAGFFIYIALSDIVPTIHTSEKSRYGLQTGFLLVGLIFGGTVSALAHEYIDVTHNHELHEDEHSEHSHALLEVNSSLPVPEISINVEEDKKSGYNLFLTTQNFTFNPDNASSEHVDGEGHAHLYINGKKITRLYSKAYYLGDFEKGSYTIVVELSSNDHSILSKNGNPIQASFELVVGEHGDHDDHDEEGHHDEETNLTDENLSDNISSELLPAYEALGCTTILKNLNDLEIYTVAIERPFPGEIISGDYLVTGCSSAFEGTVVWQLLDIYGNSVGSGFTNGGSFSVDKFEFYLETEIFNNGKYFLEVYETDPSDGESSLKLDGTTIPIYINNEIITSTTTIDVEVEKFSLSVAEGIPEELQIIEVKLGTKAIIEINSSVNTELHIHGYDLYIDIQKDNTQELAFDFNIAGEFEIEDHNSGYEVARIRVNP
jgi:zinc and cadmium transporter